MIVGMTNKKEIMNIEELARVWDDQKGLANQKGTYQFLRKDKCAELIDDDLVSNHFFSLFFSFDYLIYEFYQRPQRTANQLV